MLWSPSLTIIFFGQINLYSCIILELLLELSIVLTLGNFILALDDHPVLADLHVLYFFLQFNLFQINILKLQSFCRIQVVLNHLGLNVYVRWWLLFAEFHLFEVARMLKIVNHVGGIRFNLFFFDILQDLAQRLLIPNDRLMRIVIARELYIFIKNESLRLYVRSFDHVSFILF